MDVLREQAVAAASGADTIIAFLGLSPELEGEEMPVHVDGFDGGDRNTIELPAAQQQLVAALAGTGKPLIVVLMNGSALALHGAAEKTAAILEAWYPGQDGGTAIAETLFGENNPSGRLPVTFYAGTDQLPAFDDYSMKNRTYRYFTGAPLYRFGHGLSYTSFAYGGAKLSAARLRAGAPLSVSVQVKNTGGLDGDETAEVYLVPKGRSKRPIQKLVSFKKVHLRKGETKTLQMTIDPRQLSMVEQDGSRSVEAGEYEIYVGGSQPQKDASIFLTFTIEGSVIVAP